MPRYICHITDKFFEWSTLADLIGTHWYKLDVIEQSNPKSWALVVERWKQIGVCLIHTKEHLFIGGHGAMKMNYRITILGTDKFI